MSRENKKLRDIVYKLVYGLIVAAVIYFIGNPLLLGLSEQASNRLDRVTVFTAILSTPLLYLLLVLPRFISFNKSHALVWQVMTIIVFCVTMISYVIIVILNT